MGSGISWTPDAAVITHVLEVVSGISCIVIQLSLWRQKLVCQNFAINVGGVSGDASYPLHFQFRLQVFHHP